MILTLIFSSLLVIGIVLFVIGCIMDDSQKKVIAVTTIILGVLTAFPVWSAIVNVAHTSESDYQEAVRDKAEIEMLISQYILTNDDDETTKIYIYEKANYYNERLSLIKDLADDPFFNWFINQKIADMDYIDTSELITIS